VKRIGDEDEGESSRIYEERADSYLGNLEGGGQDPKKATGQLQHARPSHRNERKGLKKRKKKLGRTDERNSDQRGMQE